MLNAAVIAIPHYTPAVIAAEITRAADMLIGLGFPVAALDLHPPLFWGLYDTPMAYELWVRADAAIVAQNLVAISEAGFGFNLHWLPARPTLIVQFHSPSRYIHYGIGKWRFGRDFQGFWGADPVYAGGC